MFGIVLVQREAILRCFCYKKAAQPGKFLHVLLYTRLLVAKHLMATSNVTIASQKVVSKHRRIPVQGTIAIFRCKHVYKKATQQAKPCSAAASQQDVV